jgi:RimJ/RimL family protein N-acetyltransferase
VNAHPTRLQTERLVVTTWLTRDVDELFAVHSDEETMRFVRQGRSETQAETADLVDQYVDEQTANGFTKWRLTDLQGHLIGRAGFGTHQGIEGRELAYTIRRDRWGQRLATEVGCRRRSNLRPKRRPKTMPPLVLFSLPGSAFLCSGGCRCLCRGVGSWRL